MHPTNLPLDGGCRCGRVRFRIGAPPLLTMACHCTGCRKMTSSAFSVSAAIPSDGFVITEGEPVVGGLHGPSPHMFCSYCMSWMFTRPEGIDTFVNIRPTMLDDPSWFAPYVETWTDEKLPWAQTPALHAFRQFPPFEAFDGLIAAYMAMTGKPIHAPTVVGDPDGSRAILQSDGSAASFADGRWQPGIAFDNRDFLNMAQIRDPKQIRTLRAEAADALVQSLQR